MSSYSTPTRPSSAALSTGGATSSSIPRTPPSQIFTRGAVGSVKTTQNVNHIRSMSNATVVSNSSSSGTATQIQQHQQNFRSRSQSRDDQSRGRPRRPRSHSRARSSPSQSHNRNLRRSESYNPSHHTTTTHASSRSDLATGISFPPPAKYREASPAPSSDTAASSRRRRHLRKTKIIMDELSRAPPEHRIACITNACEVLDHHDVQYHCSELSLGVATVLVNQINATSKQEEIRMLVAALEMVLRASSQSLQVAFEAWPFTIVERLVRLLESHETARIPHGEITSLNLLKILISLAKVPGLRPTLWNTTGMQTVLLRISKPLHKLIRLKLLNHLCQHEQIHARLLDPETPSLLMKYLLYIAHNDTEAARQYVASILMELASSSVENQTTMAHDDKILGTIVKLILTDSHAGTRESVLTALQNLAYVHGNRPHLVTFKQGIVLEALVKALVSDAPKARRRAAGALTNLACDGTANILGDHPGLLDALAVASTQRDAGEEVQTRASLALTKIAGSISVTMSCFGTVLASLVVASLSTSAGNVAAILRLKARLPENRPIMARHPGLLDTLADLSHGPHRTHAVRALMHMANDPSNHELLGHSHVVLDALVTGASVRSGELASAVDDADNDVRDCAMVALERLAVCVHLRPHLARHPGLLTVVAQAVEREAHLQQHNSNTNNSADSTAYLAKPLLMSLLVAM